VAVNTGKAVARRGFDPESRYIILSFHVPAQQRKAANMGSENFILSYARACGSGNLPFSECGPVWQCGIIAALLVAAIVVLIALRLQPAPQPAGS